MCDPCASFSKFSYCLCDPVFVLNEKITNFSNKLNINVQDVNVFGSFKKIANDLDEQIENQRNKFRESLVKKGIDERNSVLIKSNGELIKDLEQR